MPILLSAVSMLREYLRSPNINIRRLLFFLGCLQKSKRNSVVRVLMVGRCFRHNVDHKIAINEVLPVPSYDSIMPAGRRAPKRVISEINMRQRPPCKCKCRDTEKRDDKYTFE
jgi:hypothetical protein